MGVRHAVDPLRRIHVFTRKKKTTKVTVPTIETTQITVPTVAGLKKAAVPAVTAAAAAAKQWGDDQAQNAGEWARPRLEQGREVAGDLTSQLAQKREEAEEARDKATKRAVGTALAAKGALKAKKKKDAKAAKKRKKKDAKDGGSLLGNIVAGLGVLALAGAAAAFVAKKQGQPKDDPWARPLTDPYVAPKTGRDSSVGTTGTATGTAGVGTAASTTGTTPTTSDAPTSNLGDTPPATLAEGDRVDLTDGGLPPEDGNKTLGEAIRDEDRRDN